MLLSKSRLNHCGVCFLFYNLCIYSNDITNTLYKLKLALFEILYAYGTQKKKCLVLKGLADIYTIWKYEHEQ